KHLQGFRAELRGFARLKFAALLHDGNAEVTDFAGALLFGEKIPKLFVLEQFVGAGMKLVKVNRIHVQRLERGFKLPPHAGDRKIIVAIHETVEVVAEFGGDNPARAVAAGQIIADELFRKVVWSVAFGGGNEVGASFGG